MSRRVLRRLQSGQKHSVDLDNRGLSESDDTDLSPTHKPSTGGADGSPENPFEVLDRERTPSDEEAKEDDDVEGSEACGGGGGGVGGEESKKHGQDNDRSQATDSLKRKKKKKKKKAKESKEEDVEIVAQEVREMLGETDEQASSSLTSSSLTHSPVRNLLSIDYRHLQPENEMRRIFGSRVVQADAGKKRTRSRGHIKTTKLVTPKQNWPHVGKSGISMSMIEGQDGAPSQFKFEHSPKYRQIQFQFLDAVESLNPDNIVAVINMHPYHIDGLLQLSDIMRLGDDNQMATELVERALYCFESSFHPLFNIAQGNCKLDYRYDENRSFFIAIFKKLVYIGHKGCHRTALEFCKLLLGLDDENDPLCVTLMIDFYAIKAGEYAYLIQMFEELETKKNLSQLPNFAFSVALAKFHLSLISKNDVNLRQDADRRLQIALLAFPATLKLLLDKCNIQCDKRVENHSFFGPSCSSRCLQHTALCQLMGHLSFISHPQSLMSLIHLYVGRSCHLWKEPEVMSWLELNVNATLDRVDKKDPSIAIYAENRKTRYQGMPKNIYRHILLSEIKDVTATLPPDMSRVSMLSFDPLPPTDRISSYTRPENPARRETDYNILQSLFQSLFPNYVLDGSGQRHRGPLEDNAAAGGEAVDDGGGGAVAAAAAGDSTATQDFRRSVTSLLDAMRDLLTNIHLPEVNQEGDADDSEEDTDDQRNAR